MRIAEHVARVDGRFAFSRSLQDPVLFTGHGGPLHSVTVTEFLLSLGFRL